MNNNNNYVDLQKPVRTKIKPLVIRTVIDGKMTLTEQGPVNGDPKVEDYVLLSALPQDLQERVKRAIQFIISGV